MATVISEFCEVVQATDGQHGLETAFNTIPDVIISDIMMPGRDGFSLCQQLRHDERTSHIPIILLTARSDDDRSEEHTSELQSLMRISYAVFCLKKKKKKIT